jgi:FKBP-type peptidyl-prolyl cis-trans isomerase FklB
VLGKETKMTADQAQEFLQSNEERVKELTLANTPENKSNKEEGEAFLTANAKKEGVTTTKSGLQYKIITKGTGEVPTDGDAVKVIYKGKLINGEIFDESQKDSTGVVTPTDLQVNYVVKGWQEALKMMPVGSKWQLFVPYNLAYGSRAAGEKIKPFSALIFELELISFTKAETPVAPTTNNVEVL